MYQSRPHYHLLDGLRGVAALVVLVYHLFEAIAFAAGAPEQNLYHGFMAVDFFFILSGFVMGYAYDERWTNTPSSRTATQEGTTLTFWGFVRRRLIRLHPMVVAGVVMGVVAFCIQGCETWSGEKVATETILWGTLLALFLLPAGPALDIRGNTEMFPLNGPHWSLFFEYIGSLLYALLLRRMSTRWLKVWVGVSAFLLISNGLYQGEGFIAYGWSSVPSNMLGGLLRLSFGYPAGLLLARLFRKRRPQPLKGPIFLLCSLALIGLLAMPNLNHGAWSSRVYLSVWYQVLCLTVFFPAIVWVAARGLASGRKEKVIRFLGRLSYPLYAIHYPLIYLYIDWINKGLHPFGEAAWTTPVALGVIALALGTFFLLCYDEPVRRFLNRKSQK